MQPQNGHGFEDRGGNTRGAARPPLPNRVAHWALGAVNRLTPKLDRVALHSTIDLEDGVLAVIEELTVRGRRATVLVEDRSRASRVRAAVPGARVRTVSRRSLRGVLVFLTSRWVMTTESLYGSPVPPPAQTLVNIWHGEPPTKTVVRFLPGRTPIPCTWAPVCSTLGRAYRAAEFGVHPLQVPIVGAPRNDRMLKADAAAVRRAVLGDTADRPALLWLPSFRSGRWGSRVRVDAGGDYPGVPFDDAALERLDDALTALGAQLVVKLHPHDVASFRGSYRSVRALTQEQMEADGLTLYPLLSAFDGLVTDMSSVWVDYLLVDKPLVFAFPDIEDYRDGRGLNLEPYEDWVPGPLVRSVDELVGAVTDVVEGRDPSADERRRARRRFHRFHDDRATARLLDGIGLGT